MKSVSRGFTKIRSIRAYLQRAKVDKLLSYRKKKYKISIDYCDGMYDRDIHTLFCFFISSCIR